MIGNGLGYLDMCFFFLNNRFVLNFDFKGSLNKFCVINLIFNILIVCVVDVSFFLNLFFLGVMKCLFIFSIGILNFKISFNLFNVFVVIILNCW